MRRAHAIQDFKTSTSSSLAHVPSSPVHEGILTLKSFMIPYPKLCDSPSDIAGAGYDIIVNIMVNVIADIMADIL